MAHIRVRHLTEVIKKEMKFWPIVCLLGPRQCGKSTLLRQLLLAPDTGTYRTLDPAGERVRAENSPALFLRQVDSWPLIVDEAQKAPAIFDEIKSIVDAKRRPGQFVLSGSVQFSSRVGIRESLTGRAAVLRLDPLTLRETTSTSIGLGDVQKYLQLGGMPGVCFIRNQATRHSYWDQWLDTTCERDLPQLSAGKLSGTLARLILEQTCVLPLPTAGSIAKELRVDTRRVTTHLNGLKDVFVLREIRPWRSATGKAIFLPFDCGLASHLGAGLRRCWQSWFLNERLNAMRFSGIAHPKTPTYYLTTRKSFIDFADDEGFHLFTDRATPMRSELMTVRALQNKVPEPLFIHCAGEMPAHSIDKQIRAVPWASLLVDRAKKNLRP